MLAVCPGTELIQYGIVFVILFLGFIFVILRNDKILDTSKKLKAFADNKIDMILKLKYALEWIENIVGKRENAGKQHFLLFSYCYLLCQRQILSFQLPLIN